jgi:hypothetical protein
VLPISLSEEEFRVLAYIRAYADSREQFIDMEWIQEQLSLSPAQIEQASSNLAAHGFADFFEWVPSDLLGLKLTISGRGTIMTNIRLTERGWSYLRNSAEDSD